MSHLNPRDCCGEGRPLVQSKGNGSFYDEINAYMRYLHTISVFKFPAVEWLCRGLSRPIELLEYYDEDAHFEAIPNWTVASIFDIEQDGSIHHAFHCALQDLAGPSKRSNTFDSFRTIWTDACDEAVRTRMLVLCPERDRRKMTENIGWHYDIKPPDYGLSDNFAPLFAAWVLGVVLKLEPELTARMAWLEHSPRIQDEFKSTNGPEMYIPLAKSECRVLSRSSGWFEGRQQHEGLSPVSLSEEKAR